MLNTIIANVNLAPRLALWCGVLAFNFYALGRILYHGYRNYGWFRFATTTGLDKFIPEHEHDLDRDFAKIQDCMSEIDNSIKNNKEVNSRPLEKRLNDILPEKKDSTPQKSTKKIDWQERL